MNQILLTCYFFAMIVLYYPIAIQNSPVDVSPSLIFTLPASILLFLWYTTIRRKEFQWKIQKKNPMTLSFGAFLMISLIGVLHTVYAFGSIQTWLFLVMGFLVYLTMGNLQLKTLHERDIDVDFPMRKYRLILPSMIFVYGLIEAFWGLYQHFYGFRDQLIQLQGNPANYDPRTYAGVKYALESGRIIGSFGNPNLYAIVLAMIIPIGLMLVFQLKKNYCRLAVVLGIGLMVLSIIFSASKGGLLAAIVGAILFFLLSGPKQFLEKKKWLMGLIIVILAFESFALIKQQRTAQETLLTRINISNSSTTQERVYYWNIAAQMIKANPLVGHGLNSFGILYGKYKPAFVGESQYAHNTFIQTFAETGILGVIALIVFFGSFMILPLLRWRSIKRPEVKMQMAAFYGAVAAFILDSFFGYSFYWKEVYWNEIFILGCIMMGGLYAAYQAEFVPEPGPWDIVWRRQPNTPFLLISPAMIIVIASLLYFWYYPVFKAELNFRTGKHALEINDDNLAAKSFSKAVHYMPIQSNYQQFIGNTLLNMGDSDRGIQQLQRAIQLNPETGSYHADLARAYMSLQRYDEAEKELKTAIDCNPNQHRYLNKVHYRTELMKLYESTGRTNEALRQMELINQIESQRN